MNADRVFLIVILLMLSLVTGTRAGGEGNPAASSLEERGKDLARQTELGEREKELTNELLTWDVKIESARQEQEKLQREIPVLEGSLAGAEMELAAGRARLAEGYEWLGRWVNSLYRHGPAVYFEVLVGASDFNQFVERAEKVKIIIAAQMKILEEVRHLADLVQDQVNAIKQTRAELTAKDEALSAQLKEMEAAKTGREQFLADLRQQSAGLAEKVILEEKNWYHSLNSLQYLLAHLDSFPWNSLAPESIALTGRGLRLVYSDQEINRKLSETGDASLAVLSVRSYPDRFSISGPAAASGGLDFNLSGNFLLAGQGKVRFQPTGLILAGAPVSGEVLGFVSSESGMALDFGGALPGYTLAEVLVEEGQLVIWLAPE